jgi:16S rRNA (uracil1498-N3)-methyltransferase
VRPIRLRRVRVQAVPALGGRVAADLRHLRTVLRLEVGAEVEVFDAQGFVARAKLLEGEIEVVETPRAAVERALVDVALPLLKGDRQDWVVEKLCELGVGTLVPLVSERAIIHELSAGKRGRYERIIEAACKQCGRNRPMLIAEPQQLAAIDTTRACMLDPRAETGLNALTREGMLLLIGPEGGFSDAETRWLVEQSVPRARLSDHVLRAETAAVAAAAVAVNMLCDLVIPEL